MFNLRSSVLHPLSWTCLLVCLAGLSRGVDTPTPGKFRPPEYTILRAGTPIKIDGKLDEAAWFAAPDVGDFHFTWWKEGKKEQTRAKLLWDDDNLYVGVICEDAHISAKHTERDGKIPEDDCFEVMITPNLETPNIYFNIEFNLLGGILDNFRPHGPSKPRAPKWDAAGVQIAGTYVGTLNNDSDTDRYWIVEAAIPFKNFAEVAKQAHPRPGTGWNLNLNRHGGKTNAQASQWSPADASTGNRTFHTPDRFGRVTFSDRSSPFGNVDNAGK
ncbi:MAG: carbohydrate-binding family 9-like protein [Verrucomicrobia bacterium]|nr:carbohydrate-binding family 9-like protein [Verrucomicrobiota bacterium]